MRMKLAVSVVATFVTCAQGQQVEVAKIHAGDGEGGELFGSTVAVSGSLAVIGAPNDPNGMGGLGSAYVYDVSLPQSPAKTAKLVGPGSALGFGAAVDICADMIIVGAPYTGNFAGRAYIFSARSGRLLTQLEADDEDEGDFFGASVAIEGNIAVVGAFGDDEFGNLSGAAYLFDVTTGEQLMKLHTDDSEPDQLLGISADVSGAFAIVGAELPDRELGAAYVFEVATGKQVIKLGPGDADGGSGFGKSVALDGSVALIGAQRVTAAPTLSAAFLFEIPSGRLIAHILTDMAGNGFGSSVALDGDTALVGAASVDDVAENAGAAYIFDVATGAQLAKLVPSMGQADDFFGAAVGVSGDVIVIGSLGDDDEGLSAGASYIFAPIACLADFNGDGAPNILDFLAFQNAWKEEKPSADCDGNAVFDLLDFLCFQAAFMKGCD